MAKGTSLFYRTLDPKLLIHHYNRYGKWMMLLTLPVRVWGGLLVGAPLYVLSRVFLTTLNPWAWRDNPVKAGLTTLTLGGFAWGAYASWGTWSALSATLNGVVLGMPGALVVGVAASFIVAIGLVVAKTLARGYHAMATRDTFNMTNPKYAHTFQNMPFRDSNKNIHPYYQAMIKQMNYRKAVKSDVLCYDIDELEARGFPNYGKSMQVPGKLMEDLNYTDAKEWLGQQKTALLSAYQLSRLDGASAGFLCDKHKRAASDQLSKTKDAFALANRGLGSDFAPIKQDATVKFEDSFEGPDCKKSWRMRMTIG